MENYFDREARNWDKENYRIVRAQTIAEAIHREIPLNQKMRGLDFGCGTGLLGFSLIDKLAHMTFWDNSEGMIDRVNGKIEADFHERGKALVYDLFSRRVESLFDVIVTLQALHHIEDRERALGILTDHLEKGGFLCLADLVEEDGSFHKNESVPHNGFKVEELEEILGRLGLRKISTTYPYSNSRTRKGKVREYPVFLMIFQK